MEARSFEDLKIYQQAVELRQVVFELTRSFPDEEKYRLADQIIRSTRKCPANIAEGHGRYHYQENIQFCRIARGSLTETLDHISCALECKYINHDKHKNLREKTITLIKMINGYIKYLQAQKEK